MDDKPTEALRRKRDSSIARCVNLVADGEADALVSAGNTGAVVAHATLRLRLLQGVKRPGTPSSSTQAPTSSARPSISTSTA